MLNEQYDADLTNLGDFVVVCEEHGQVLRLLNGRRLGHFSEELSSTERKQDRGFVLIIKRNTKQTVSITHPSVR